MNSIPVIRALGFPLICSLCMSSQFAYAPAESAPLKSSHPVIEGIYGYLVYSHADLVDNANIIDPSFALSNTIIGEGSAKGPSSATLFIVKLSAVGIPPTFSGTASLEISDQSRIISKQSLDLSTFYSGGRELFVPFLVYGPLCGSLTIEASLTGGSEPSASPVKKVINARCGE